jgi:hypothetical protein
MQLKFSVIVFVCSEQKKQKRGKSNDRMRGKREREKEKNTFFYRPANKGNNKITELRTISQRESQNS